MIYAQHHDPASVRCETVIDGLVCGEPATHTRSRPFQDAGHTWWRHEPICESCSHALRSREIDQWLQEVGARVIQVVDLGAAMGAREWGARAIEHATRPPMYGWAQAIGAYVKGGNAARLARLALGEG